MPSSAALRQAKRLGQMPGIPVDRKAAGFGAPLERHGIFRVTRKLECPSTRFAVFLVPAEPDLISHCREIHLREISPAGQRVGMFGAEFFSQAREPSLARTDRLPEETGALLRTFDFRGDTLEGGSNPRSRLGFRMLVGKLHDVVDLFADRGVGQIVPMSLAQEFRQVLTHLVEPVVIECVSRQILARLFYVREGFVPPGHGLRGPTGLAADQSQAVRQEGLRGACNRLFPHRLGAPG